jgi:hypothetical protein
MKFTILSSLESISAIISPFCFFLSIELTLDIEVSETRPCFFGTFDFKGVKGVLGFVLFLTIFKGFFEILLSFSLLFKLFVLFIVVFIIFDVDKGIFLVKELSKRISSSTSSISICLLLPNSTFAALHSLSKWPLILHFVQILFISLERTTHSFLMCPTWLQ